MTELKRGRQSPLSLGLPEQDRKGALSVLMGHWPLAKQWKPNVNGVPVAALRKLPGHVAAEASSPCIGWAESDLG